MGKVNIYDPYPESVEVDGKVYSLNLAYDRVLRVMDVAADSGLTPGDMLDLQALLLLKNRRDLPKDVETQMRLVKAVFDLFPKPNKAAPSEKYIDFHQDAALIRSAFLRVGIDLQKEHIHFLRFLEVLGDLPEDTALMRVVDIRSRPLPKRTKHNAEQIAALQKAKARVAIRYTDEETRAIFAEKLKQSSALRG